MERIKEYLNNLANNDEIYIQEEQERKQKELEQAEVLNQCILRCGYLNKVIKQKSLLIFVQKNGTPIATVEVNSNAEIIQEYADEFDRTNCKPSEEVKNIVREWIKERPSLKWEMPSPTLSNVA